MKLIKKLAMIMSIIILFSILSACVKDSNPIISDYFIQFQLVELYKDGKKANPKDFSEPISLILKDLEDALSVKKNDSYISKINNAKANEKVLVNELTMDILKLSKEYYALTMGAFNPAVYNLVDLWGFSPRFEGKYSESREEPSKENIANFLKFLNFEDVIIDEENMTVSKPSDEMKLDLGGIAKGYACDLVEKYLKDLGYTNILMSIMSNISLVGQKIDQNEPGGMRDFQVNIKDPENSWDSFMLIEAADCSVTTSGDYERYYENNGYRYCHIIDPKTGKPVVSEIRSVTILNDTGVLGDALATAVFSLGIKNGAALLEENNVKAIIIIDDGTYVNVGNVKIFEPKKD